MLDHTLAKTEPKLVPLELALKTRAQELGLRIVGLELFHEDGQKHLAVFLESLEMDKNPLSLEELSSETAWISKLVDELDPLESHFMLEVSSPGLRRPLVSWEDFERFCKERIELVYIDPATNEEQSSFGLLQKAYESQDKQLIVFEPEKVKKKSAECTETLELDFEALRSARLAPDFSYLSQEKKTFKKTPQKSKKSKKSKK